MKYVATLPPIDCQDVPGLSVGGPNSGTDATWEIEELTQVHEGLGSRWSNRWVSVVVAVAVGIVGFGFVGQRPAEKPVAPEHRGVEVVEPYGSQVPDAPFALLAPTGETVIR